MRIYTTESLGSRNQQLTPEGFLLCLNVPIARVGMQLYGPGEVPVEPGTDGIVWVEREANQVFREETIASFAGKPVTNDHPTEDVTPENWKVYAVGVVMNPRRGTNVEDGLLIADLLITDAVAIAAVRDGKREVSCGYDADYETISAGLARQTQIVGNHVALVEHGRCGSRCAIGDESMTKKTWTDRLLAAFKSRDESAFKEALEGAKDDAGEPGAEGTHVHVHLPEKTETQDEGEKGMEERVKKIEDSLKGFANDMKTVKDTVQKWVGTGGKKVDNDDPATADAEGEEEKKDKETKDSKTVDSVALEDEFTETTARAEILAPGIRLPTFDAALAPKSTNDRLCALRRRAIIEATKDEDSKPVLDALLGGNTVDKLDCAAAKIVFDGAAELLRQRNNEAGRGRGGTADRGDKGKTGIQSVADLNTAMRAHYNQDKR